MDSSQEVTVELSRLSPMGTPPPTLPATDVGPAALFSEAARAALSSCHDAAVHGDPACTDVLPATLSSFTQMTASGSSALGDPPTPYPAARPPCPPLPGDTEREESYEGDDAGTYPEDAHMAQLLAQASAVIVAERRHVETLAQEKEALRAHCCQLLAVLLYSSRTSCTPMAPSVQKTLVAAPWPQLLDLDPEDGLVVALRELSATQSYPATVKHPSMPGASSAGGQGIPVATSRAPPAVVTQAVTSSERGSRLRPTPASSSSASRSHGVTRPLTIGQRSPNGISRGPTSGDGPMAAPQPPANDLTPALPTAFSAASSTGLQSTAMINRLRRALAPSPTIQQLGDVVDAMVSALLKDIREREATGARRRAPGDRCYFELERVRLCTYRLVYGVEHAVKALLSQRKQPPTSSRLTVVPHRGLLTYVPTGREEGGPHAMSLTAGCQQRLLHFSIDSGALCVRSGGGSIDFLEYLERRRLL